MANNGINVGMTVKDVINARNSSTKLQSAPKKFSVKAMAVASDVDKETGEFRDVGYLVATDGTVYGTVSPTAIQTIRACAEAVEAKELELPLDFSVAMKKSNAGREFICLSVL